MNTYFADHTKYQPYQKCVYVIQTRGSEYYVADVGYCSHWDSAKQFQCHGDAKDYLNVRRKELEAQLHPDHLNGYLRIVRLTVAVTQVKVFE